MKFLLFASLLMSSFATTTHIKGSEHENEPEPDSITDARDRDFFDSDLDDELDRPLSGEIYFIIQRVLRNLGASADEPLKRMIAKLTFGFDKDTIENLVTAMVDESPTNSIDRDICLEKLTKIIQKQEKKDRIALKLKQLAETILENFSPVQDNENQELIVPQQQPSSSTQENENPEVAASQQTAPGNIPKYPLLADVFHPDKEFFIEVAEQLKAGKFSREFSKGILFYGPPGVGKNEMINALVNESGCLMFSIGATELVNKFQGSGAGTIASIFNQAKTADSSKGVIVLIDELQNLTPLTNDKKVEFAHTRSGQDYDDAFTQLWLEYDRCLNHHDNIMIIATCNEFHRIDERIRGRFDCIEFSYPDKYGTYEILKNKSKYFDIPFSKEELQNCVKKTQGLSGRDLTKFMKNVKKELLHNKGKKEAVKRALEKQAKVKDDAKLSSNKRIKQLTAETLRGAAYGAGGAIGSKIVSIIFKIFELGINYFNN